MNTPEHSEIIGNQRFDVAARTGFDVMIDQEARVVGVREAGQ